jgi:hypothetical protein
MIIGDQEIGDLKNKNKINFFIYVYINFFDQKIYKKELLFKYSCCVNQSIIKWIGDLENKS